MILEKGRPQSNEGRLDKEIRTYDFLDSLGVDYERIDHEPAMTMEVCEEVDRVLGATICKNLFLCNRQQTDFYLLMIDGRKQFRTSEVSKKIGVSRLSFASAEDMERYLGVTPGSVSILGLMNDIGRKVNLVIDKDVIAKEYVRCHPCRNLKNHQSVQVQYNDLVVCDHSHFPKNGEYHLRNTDHR
jgi:Ala-tRNA(Pro) deacylase